MDEIIKGFKIENASPFTYVMEQFFLAGRMADQEENVTRYVTFQDEAKTRLLCNNFEMSINDIRRVIRRLHLEVSNAMRDVRGRMPYPDL